MVIRPIARLSANENRTRLALPAESRSRRVSGFLLMFPGKLWMVVAGGFGIHCRKRAEISRRYGVAAQMERAALDIRFQSEGALLRFSRASRRPGSKHRPRYCGGSSLHRNRRNVHQGAARLTSRVHHKVIGLFLVMRKADANSNFLIKTGSKKPGA